MAKSTANSNLHKAKKGKNDEFYNQLSDIENKLKHYKDHFKGKVVYPLNQIQELLVTFRSNPFFLKLKQLSCIGTLKF